MKLENGVTYFASSVVFVSSYLADKRLFKDGRFE